MTARANTTVGAGDFIEIISAAVQGVRALWTPTEAEIEGVGNEFGKWCWALAGPLLTASTAENFDRKLALMTRGGTVIKEFRGFTKKSAFKAWLQQAEQKAKVQALQPHPSADEIAVELRDDLNERLDKLQPFVDAAKKRAGVKRPPQQAVDDNFVRFLVTFTAVHIAAASGSLRISEDNVQRAYDACTKSIRQMAGFYKIPWSRASTSRDKQLERRRTAYLAALHAQASAAEHLPLSKEIEVEGSTDPDYGF